MKQKLLMIALLSGIPSAYAMNDASAAQASISDDDMTPGERACFNWFEKLAKEDPSYLKDVPKDRKAFNTHEAVRKSRVNTARIFLAHVSNKGIKPEYNEEQLTGTLIKVSKKLLTDKPQKPTDLFSARIYVSTTFISQEEQKRLSDEEIYLSNVAAAEAVVDRWSQLLTNELVALKLVEDTSEARAAKAKELADEKKALLKKMYAQEEAQQ